MYLKNGDDWTGTCDTGLAQSPINIDTQGTFEVNNNLDFHAEYNVIANRTLVLTAQSKSVQINFVGGAGSLVLTTPGDELKIYEAL